MLASEYKTISSELRKHDILLIVSWIFLTKQAQKEKQSVSAATVDDKMLSIVVPTTP